MVALTKMEALKAELLQLQLEEAGYESEAYHTALVVLRRHYVSARGNIQSTAEHVMLTEDLRSASRTAASFAIFCVMADITPLVGLRLKNGRVCGVLGGEERYFT